MLILNPREDRIFICVLLISFVIYNLNLGLMPLLADEPTRAIVSLEMVLSGNYTFPTIAGEAYLNKPPLFNWLVAACMNSTDHFSEWHLRILPLLSFFAIAVTHYVIASKYVTKQNALWSSLAFLTCGRIIFYDSMMGYIDPVFSFIVLLNFYWILIQSKKDSYAKTFLVSYSLCTLAFLLKGLPACTFQAFTLLAVFIYRNKFKDLVSLAHLFGISIFVLCLSLYYYEYGEYADIKTVLLALVEQSTQRTPVSTKITETFLHIIEFPFQFIVDFLPFSALLVFCFRKNIVAIFKENDFVFVSIIIVAANIWLYWLSAETRARYLFMFLPLFFSIVVYAYEKFNSEPLEKGIRIFVYILILALTLVLVLLPFLRRFAFVSNSILISISSILIAAVVGYIVFKRKFPALLGVILMLLILRTDFNLFIIPLRKKESSESMNKLVGQSIAQLTSGKKLFLLPSVPVNHDILYYTTKERNAIITKRSVPLPGIDVYYICRKDQVEEFLLEPVYSFDVTYEGLKLFVAKR